MRAIGRKENWTINEVSRVTLFSGLAHALSTIIIGVIIGLLGLKLTESVQHFSHIVAPLVLILVGIFFIYQHHRHRHFHLHNQAKEALSKNKIITALVVAIFFSSCMEIEAYFLLAGSFGWYAILSIALLYLIVSVTGMVLWVRLAYKGIIKLNWHRLEHNAGIITGLTLIITGILTFYIH